MEITKVCFQYNRTYVDYIENNEKKICTLYGKDRRKITKSIELYRNIEDFINGTASDVVNKLNEIKAVENLNTLDEIQLEFEKEYYDAYDTYNRFSIRTERYETDEEYTTRILKEEKFISLIEIYNKEMENKKKIEKQKLKKQKEEKEREEYMRLKKKFGDL